jgi:competence protein ComEC
MRKLKILVLALSFILMLASCNVLEIVIADLSNNSSKVVSTSTDDLVVYFVDVGQGDCILLSCNGKNMMVDGGSSSSESKLKSFMAKVGVTELGYIVLTHPDEDHVGGLDVVVDKWATSETVIYAPRVIKDTIAFENFATAVQSKGLLLTAPVSGSAFSLGSATGKILAPNQEKYDDTNNYSIVLKVFTANGSFLLMGDAEEYSENQILSKYNVDSDVLKVGHHGSSSSTSVVLYKAVSPVYSVISVGKDNKYSHPYSGTLNTISPSIVYRTDKDGTIVFKLSKDGFSVATNY